MGSKCLFYSQTSFFISTLLSSLQQYQETKGMYLTYTLRKYKTQKLLSSHPIILIEPRWDGNQERN